MKLDDLTYEELYKLFSVLAVYQALKIGVKVFRQLKLVYKEDNYDIVVVE